MASMWIMPKAKRDHALYVRLTKAEHEALLAFAPSYMALSDWVRQTLATMILAAQERAARRPPPPARRSSRKRAA
mgnify:CR=1 FL=1